jgi:E3 ubiquitin-protein ligase SHPRH
MLHIVARGLKANGIVFALCIHRADFGTLGGIQSFKTDPDVRVLLLPLSLGAEGLDLIAANHVFLLEPIMSSFQEAQVCPCLFSI